MKKLYWVILMLMAYRVCEGQNLVSNGGFEDTIRCQQWINLDDYPFLICTPWYQAVSSPDFFSNSVGLAFCGASALYPNTPAGYKYPHNGFGMAGFGMSVNNREIIGQPLQSSLVQNHSYYVEFYVSASDNCSLQTDDIGAHLSVDSLNPDTPYTFNIVPQIENPQGVTVNDTIGWTKISGFYTASGGEKYIAIGNFKSDANTTYDTIPGLMWPNIGYYFLDDVGVIDSTPVGINELEQLSLTLFPNPFTDNLTITLNKKEPVELNLYDIVGRKLLQQTFITSTTINNSQLAKGVYIYEVRSDGGVIKKGKVVKE